MSSLSISRCNVFFFIVSLTSALFQLFAKPNDQNELINLTHFENSNSLTISADFLIWFPSEEVGSIWADVITSLDNTASWGAPGFDFKWDLGFRIGIGYYWAVNRWDTSFYWTRFQSDAKHSINSNPHTTLHPEFFAAFLSGDAPMSMSASWNLLFNMFDWEVGRSFWIGKNIDLRFFLGIKGGWIDQSIYAKYYDLTIDFIFPTHNSGKEHLKNNFWGIGPLVGINSKWNFYNFGSHFFDLFGDFSASTMWGSWFCKDIYRNTVPKTSSVNTKSSTLGALMFQGFMGIGWSVDFHNRSHFAAKIGYEMQFWLNQLRFATFQIQRLHDDLTMMGITFKCRLDF